MAQKKKTRAGAKKPGRGAGNGTEARPVRSIGLALLLLFGLVAAAVFLFDRHIPREKPVKAAKPPAAAHRKTPAPPEKKPSERAAAQRPVYEVFPPAEKGPAPGKPAPGSHRVAIVIDDLGYNPDLDERFLALDYPITVSVLPHAPFSKAIAARAREMGKQVLLHLPMEPREYPEVDPGPGALLSGMSTDEMLSTLEGDLAAVPHVQGVNNHMGSLLSREETVLNPLFTALKARGLFFLDSMTAPGGQARAAARLLRLPFAQRDVFLDHEVTKEFIEGQIDRLLFLAAKNGKAIGIGHPHELTYEVLVERLPEMSREANLTPVSELTEILE